MAIRNVRKSVISKTKQASTKRRGDGAIIPIDRIERSILLIRGHKVMFDTDLAELYGVSVGRLNEAVKRNINRFPEDFMFRLTDDEYKVCLKSQFAIAKLGRGGRRTLPYVFTE